VSPANYTHSAAFLPLANSLCAALNKLGHPTKIITESRGLDPFQRTIILGAHLLGDVILPNNWIIFNLEQIGEGFAASNNYIAMLQRHEVWDYSHLNIAALKKVGVSAKFCGIGYMPCLSTIRNIRPDIDVLFYGSLNKRRTDILNELSEALPNKVQAVFGIYGTRLDNLISRSKIILNIHYYESKIWEIVRCSYLLANKKCIVSEMGEDTMLEKSFTDAVVFAPYDNLVERCLTYLEYDAVRERKAEIGFEVFSKMSQVDYLRAVL
jgi:hypothetical protein